MVEAPVVAAPALAGRFARDEGAARDGLQVGGDGRDHLDGGAVVGLVVTRDPAAVVVGLALAVHLERRVGARLARRVEVEAGGGPRPVEDGHLGLAALRGRARERHVQHVVRDAELARGPRAVLHAEDRGLLAVQAQDAQRVHERDESHGGLAVHVAVVDVGRDAHDEVGLVEVAGRRVERRFGMGAGGREHRDEEGESGTGQQGGAAHRGRVPGGPPGETAGTSRTASNGAGPAYRGRRSSWNPRRRTPRDARLGPSARAGGREPGRRARGGRGARGRGSARGGAGGGAARRPAPAGGRPRGGGSSAGSRPVRASALASAAPPPSPRPPA